MSTGQYTYSHTLQKSYRQYPQKPNSSQKWTQYMDTSSWDWTRKLTHNNLPTPTREIPLPKSPYGTERIIRRMVLPLGRHHPGPPLGKKNSGSYRLPQNRNYFTAQESCYSDARKITLQFHKKTRTQQQNQICRAYHLRRGVQTDATRLYGLGFALIQKSLDGNNISLIQCGSCSHSETQQRYTTIELRCLAIKWAVNKCNFYLRGLPAFIVLTDHRPLMGIFHKQLHELDNARLMRMREKLTNFSFELKWVKGKTQIITDALSRAPVFQPEEDEDEAIDTAIQCLRVRESSELADIADAIDENYNSIVQAIKTDAEFKYLPSHHPAQQLFSINTQLSLDKLGEVDVIMLDGSRIVVPRGARKNIIKELHRAHSGLIGCCHPHLHSLCSMWHPTSLTCTEIPTSY